MKDSRDHHNHPNDMFEAIIVNCSVKNYDRSYNGEMVNQLCTIAKNVDRCITNGVE